MSNFPGKSPYGSPQNNPYNPQPSYIQGPPQRKGPSAGKVIMIIGAVIGLLVVCSCCICGSLAYVGLDAESNEVSAAVQDDPTIKREIGNITSCSINWSATGDHSDPNAFVYDIEGDKGAGKLITLEEDWANSTVLEIELEKNGQTFPITFDESKFSY